MSQGILEEATYFQIEALVELLQPQNRPDLTRKDVILHFLHNDAKFDRLKLMRLDFSGLRLDKKVFDLATLTEADFSNASLVETSFHQVEATGKFWRCYGTKGNFQEFKPLQSYI